MTRNSILTGVVALAWVVSASACRTLSHADAAAGAASAVSPDRTAARAAGTTVATARRLDPQLEDLSVRTFRFFWERGNSRNGLIPDRWPTPSFSSIAAVGFGLTAYPIGVERGYVTRQEAAQRTLTTLDFFVNAPQGPEATGVSGYKGFFYHFLDMETGLRYQTVELSTIDTALLVAGALVAQEYFDRADPVEEAIRDRAKTLYERVDWTWAQNQTPLVTMGWTPETGFHHLTWQGYNEALILYILALGSPTHPIDGAAWTEYTRTYVWSTFYGQQFVQFAPLFGHQYSLIYIDARRIRDAYMQARRSDYFQNSRRATISQRNYARANPLKWRGYDGKIWGISACDGPFDGEFPIDGTPRRFYSYAGRGVGAGWSLDDGTLAPTAALASLPFAPALVRTTLHELRRRYGAELYSTYGFFDAFNPTLTAADAPVRFGRLVPGVGWFDTDYLGLDQGPIVAMIENHRSELIWRLMRRNAAIVRGLRRAGFRGGWLDAAP